MAKRKALIVWGGWNGHEPEKVANRFRVMLENEDFEVDVSDTLEAFEDIEKLNSLHLIIPVWTMGQIEGKLANNVIEAVANGTGIAGCHGGMCDAFRNTVQWQFMTGGNWVAHPGGDGVEFTVNITNNSSPITEGIHDFKVCTEQYYLHVDPANEVLATTTFPVVKWYHSSNGIVRVPVLWTKKWGVGRVFYSALGHHDDVFETYEAAETMRRGFLWAAEGKDIAIRDGLNSNMYKNEGKMF